jgi:hypothetical protein
LPVVDLDLVDGGGLAKVHHDPGAMLSVGFAVSVQVAIVAF